VSTPVRPRVAPGAAKAFGFSIPAGVLSIVDEVIESLTDVRFWQIVLKKSFFADG
jgi:hypothetical protein